MSNGGDYEHDFFLSYPVHSAAGEWVRNHFLPVLREELENTGPPPSLFCWLENEIGVLWPERLKRAHSRSRILVAILTPPYFYKSQWCPIEWHTMVKREQLAKLGNQLGATESLICPVLFSDGDTLPPETRVVTAKDFRPWAYPDLVFKNTTEYLPFRLAVRGLAEELLNRRLPLAPRWSPDWPEIEPPPRQAPRAGKPQLEARRDS
jgi:hypothetical protein